MDGDEISGAIVSAALEVHTRLGPGLLESAYETCLAYELRQRGYRVETERPMPIAYGNVTLDCGYRLDLLVEDTVVVELKAVEALLPLHEAQLLTYLKLSEKRIGLLLNFNVQHMKDGIRRMVR